MYNPMGLYKNLWPARGYTRGLYTKKFLLRIYAQKAAPGLHKGKNRRFKKKNFILHLQPKNGVIYKGVIHEALQYTGQKVKIVIKRRHCPVYNPIRDEGLYTFNALVIDEWVKLRVDCVERAAAG